MLDKLRFFCDVEKDRIVFDRRIQKVGCSFNLCMILYVGSSSGGHCCLLVADADSAIFKLRCNLAKKDCKPFEVNSLHCSLLFSVNDSLSFLLFLSLLFLTELFHFLR